MYDYDKIPLGYYDTIYKRRKGVRSFWHWLKFDVVARKLTKGDAVLDIGCFSGTFLGQLNTVDFPRQFGVDILSEQINQANQQYGNEHRKFSFIASIQDLARSVGQVVDQITLIEVIEHLDSNELNTLFEELVKILPKGGRVLLTTPNYLSFWCIQEYLVDRVAGLNYAE